MANPARWSETRANDWYAGQPWFVGANYTPATAINQLEMWQAETFDPATIDRELSLAADLGMNAMRVFLHDLLWESDAQGFAARIEQFLRIADSHGIAALFVPFDDCWHAGATLGPQPAPQGRHNSGWLQSPGHAVVLDEAHYPRLEAYVSGLVRRFAGDSRVLGWDLYNEPTNLFLPLQHLSSAEREARVSEAMRRREVSKPAHLRLVQLAFEWARKAAPSQPLTVGAYNADRELNAVFFEESDIISFHNYEGTDRLETLITSLKRHGRPILCTEYMARTRVSLFTTHLPIFKREKIGAFNWGFVNGKTETHLPWVPDPAETTWFHDVLRGDGTPYDPAEVAVIRELTGRR